MNGVHTPQVAAQQQPLMRVPLHLPPPLEAMDAAMDAKAVLLPQLKQAVTVKHQAAAVGVVEIAQATMEVNGAVTVLEAKLESFHGR